MKSKSIETLESPLLQNVSAKMKVWRRYCCVVVALLLQNKPTISNGWRIAVVDVSFSVALLFRSPPAMVGYSDTIAILVVDMSTFSNVSSGAICCWPRAHCATSSLYEGEGVKMVQSGIITKARRTGMGPLCQHQYII